MKKSVLILIAAVVVLAWAALVPAYYWVDGDKRLWAVCVTAVAVITEVGFWAAAATLGLAVIDARRSLVRWFNECIGAATRDDASQSGLSSSRES